MNDRTHEDYERSFDRLRLAPTDRKEHARWLEDLHAWKIAAARDLEYSGDRYHSPGSIWAQSAFVCGVVMLWETAFYDPATGDFLVEDYLDHAEREFGGLDALILWHAYPLIGFDDRNQFDFYRDIPRGLEGLADIVARLHARGVKAILDYNPWDAGTRRETLDDGRALSEILEISGADGVFLDTLASADVHFLDTLDSAIPGIALQSELDVPLDQIATHAMSWVQWPENAEDQVLIRNTWFEPRHMQHVVRRWHESHEDELHIAWLNGTGILIWENVFGSWRPWSKPDKALLSKIRSVQRAAAPFFMRGVWTPYLPTDIPALSVSRWDLDGASLWAFSNRSDADAVADASYLETDFGRRRVDVLAGIDVCESVVVPSHGVACVLSFTDEAAREWHHLLRLSTIEARPSEPPHALLSRREAPNVRASNVPSGMQHVASGFRHLTAVFRSRECGHYARVDRAGQAHPELSGNIRVQRDGEFSAFAIAEAPVTNAEFHRFIQDTGYQPADPTNFLRHWRAGAPRTHESADPVVWVELADARAYARWAFRRLPTEDEWQVGMTETAAGYGTRRVWEWTESEHSDSHTRFAIVKAGSDLPPAESGWYAERGPLDPERSAKLLLFHPGLDRSSTIGFRTAVDL